MGNQMGSFFRRVRSEDDAEVNVDSRYSAQHPISDELEEKIQVMMREIAEPYQKCLNSFRQKEEALSKQKHDLEQREMELQRKEQLLNRKGQQIDQNTVEALQRENAQLREELQQLKKINSASHTSRKRHRDIRPGDVTHEHLLEKYQTYYSTRKILYDLKFTTKEERCLFLTSILKVAYKHSNDYVQQAVMQELKLLCQPPDHPFQYDQHYSTKEKWMDRSSAFGLLLSVAEIEPMKCPEFIQHKVFLELLEECESFKTAYETNQGGVQSILESAINIAWVMNTLVPPASFYEPEQYHEEWHELVTAPGTSEMDLEGDYKLDYCRPILFFGAEGTVGKVGAVKCKTVAWTEASDDYNPLLQTAAGSANQ